jgi:RpiR family transcriptional regulator, carbohydrate utilization regulator
VRYQFADYFNSRQSSSAWLGLPSSPAPDGRIGDVARAATSKDVVFAISFRRGLRMTVEGCERARKNGDYCIGISDSLLSPLARLADLCLIVSAENTVFRRLLCRPWRRSMP